MRMIHNIEQKEEIYFTAYSQPFISSGKCGQLLKKYEEYVADQLTSCQKAQTSLSI